MSRFLLSTMPSPGHLAPAEPLAAALVARGHEVRWHTGPAGRPAVTRSGATFVPFDATRTLEELVPQPRPDESGLTAINAMLRRLLVDRACGQLADYEKILTEFPADVVIADICCLGAALLHDKGGPPWAVLNVTALTGICPNDAPWGTGGQPATSAPLRLRNRTVNWLGYHVILRRVTAAYRQIRDQVGLRPVPWRHTVFDATLSPYLYMQPTAAAFEYPRTDLPAQVHIVGPMPPPVPDFTEPPWWPELLAWPSPVVHVTQGTTATNPDELTLPAIRALGGGSALVVVTLPDPDRLGPLPPNVRASPYLPYQALLPHVDVMVTNAGYSGVQLALAAGVPVVAAGTTGDQPEVCARVAWSGAGRWLRSAKPSPEQVADAVTDVLTDRRYRAAAARLAGEFAAHDGPATAAGLLERLATTRAPVLAGDPPPC